MTIFQASSLQTCDDLFWLVCPEGMQIEMFRRAQRERPADPIYSGRSNFVLSEGTDSAEKNTGSISPLWPSAWCICPCLSWHLHTWFATAFGIYRYVYEWGIQFCSTSLQKWEQNKMLDNPSREEKQSESSSVILNDLRRILFLSCKVQRWWGKRVQEMSEPLAKFHSCIKNISSSIFQ